MTATPAPVCIDPDELLALPNGDHYELIDGVPVEKVMGVDSEVIAFDLGTLLNVFAKQHDLGRAFGSNMNYVCFPNRPKQLRKPDASFIAKGRLPADWRPQANITIAPDLAVEVISPHDLANELDIKLAEYYSAGVRLIWVIGPGSKTVLVRRLDGTAQVLQESDTLTGENIIPGFSVKVADLFV